MISRDTFKSTGPSLGVFGFLFCISDLDFKIQNTLPIGRFSLSLMLGCYTCQAGSRIFPQFAVIIPDDGARLISKQATREKYIFIFK